MSAVPVPDPAARLASAEIVLEGDIPSPADPPSGCRFHTRCWLAASWLAETDEPTADGVPLRCATRVAGADRRRRRAPRRLPLRRAHRPRRHASDAHAHDSDLPRVAVVQNSPTQRPRPPARTGSPRSGIERGRGRRPGPARAAGRRATGGRRVGAARRRLHARRRRARPVPAARTRPRRRGVDRRACPCSASASAPSCSPIVAGGEVTARSGRDRARIVRRRTAAAAGDDPLFAGLTGYDELRMIQNHRGLDHGAAAGCGAPGDVGAVPRAGVPRRRDRVGRPVPPRDAGRPAWPNGTSPSWPPKGSTGRALLAQATADAPINTEQSRALVGAFADVVREARR